MAAHRDRIISVILYGNGNKSTDFPSKRNLIVRFAVLKFSPRTTNVLVVGRGLTKNVIRRPFKDTAKGAD